MSEENAPQKERYLREVEQKLLHRELDARLLDDGQIHIRWKEKPLCSVDRDATHMAAQRAAVDSLCARRACRRQFWMICTPQSRHTK